MTIKPTALSKAHGIPFRAVVVARSCSGAFCVSESNRRSRRDKNECFGRETVGWSIPAAPGQPGGPRIHGAASLGHRASASHVQPNASGPASWAKSPIVASPLSDDCHHALSEDTTASVDLSAIQREHE